MLNLKIQASRIKTDFTYKQIKLNIQEIMELLIKIFGRKIENKYNGKTIQSRIREYFSHLQSTFVTETNGLEFLLIVKKESKYHVLIPNGEEVQEEYTDFACDLNYEPTENQQRIDTNEQYQEDPEKSEDYEEMDMTEDPKDPEDPEDPETTRFLQNPFNKPPYNRPVHNIPSYPDPITSTPEYPPHSSSLKKFHQPIIKELPLETSNSDESDLTEMYDIQYEIKELEKQIQEEQGELGEYEVIEKVSDEYKDKI